MELLRCSRCNAPRDTADNFCRRCGHQLTVEVSAAAASVPALRSSQLPVRSQALPRSLMGSVAVLAIGTGVEWLARRFAGNAARAASRAAGRALVGQEQLPSRSKPRSASPDSVSVDEFIYVRKVELRR
ncbi:MAG: hypothetical protein GEU75_15495 [Dehalococcoidia bacterium]|nr:hypothetical protein [Dehalococcoidia bacterium]